MLPSLMFLDIENITNIMISISSPIIKYSIVLPPYSIYKYITNLK